MKALNPHGGPDLDVSFPSGEDVKWYGKTCRDCGGSAGERAAKGWAE
jgi:hypothetical protein